MFREIFTWWNGQTIGTRVWSYFNGIHVGSDEQGNIYYRNTKDTKRWVIYRGIIESTRINPEWNNWLRYTSLSKPTDKEKYNWQKTHLPNQTGTDDAYDPKKNETKTNLIEKKDDYNKWSPEE